MLALPVPDLLFCLQWSTFIAFQLFSSVMGNAFSLFSPLTLQTAQIGLKIQFQLVWIWKGHWQFWKWLWSKKNLSRIESNIMQVHKCYLTDKKRYKETPDPPMHILSSSSSLYFLCSPQSETPQSQPAALWPLSNALLVLFDCSLLFPVCPNHLSFPVLHFNCKLLEQVCCLYIWAAPRSCSLWGSLYKEDKPRQGILCLQLSGESLANLHQL